MSWRTHFRAGLAGIRQRPGLTVGLYALGLAFSLVMVLPLGRALEAATAHAALPLDLREVTPGMWGSILEATAAGRGTTMLLAVLLVPLHGLIRAAVLAGAAAALRPGDLLGFWAGVGRYGWRGLLVAVLFFVYAVLWLVAASFDFGLLALLFPGEMGSFWTQFVIGPLVALAGLATLDLMQDYARAAIVMDDVSAFDAVGAGAGFLRRHRMAIPLYLAWFALASVLWLLPFFLDVALSTAVFGLLVLQQLALFARSAVTVGWIGSSMSLYADARDRERIWIAGGPVETTASNA